MVDGEASAEVLRYNPSNATTEVVERVQTADGSLVRKALRRFNPGLQIGPAQWAASDDPRHWNYWHREAEVYVDELLRASLSGTGLGVADAEVVEQDSGTTLWLEDVTGTAGADFSVCDHVATASALERWQALPPLTQPWSSRRFLCDYSTSRPSNLAVVDNDDAWAQPLIRAAWPHGLRDGWARMLAHRGALLDLMEQLPRATSHLTRGSATPYAARTARWSYSTGPLPATA